MPPHHRLLLVIALALLGANCHRTPRPLDLQTMQVDTLWYATARQRVDNRLVYALADSMEYGFYRVATRAGIDPVRDDLDMRVIDSTRVSAPAFLAAIAAPSPDSNGVVVLSVHGYKTDHRKAIRDAAESYRRSGTRARWVAFSWPSTGRAINWNLPGAFITGAYRDDSVAAVKSRPAFVQLANAMHATLGGRRLVIVTHSLGAQIVNESLASDSTLRTRMTGQPIRALGFFEPDMPAERFVGFSMPLLRPLASRIALYASRNDLMLLISRVVNRNTRAGLVGERDVLSDHLETIDATDGLSSESFWRRSFGTHHGMRRESGALRDFFDIVVPHANRECRTLRGTAHQIEEGFWRLIGSRGTNEPCNSASSTPQ